MLTPLASASRWLFLASVAVAVEFAGATTALSQVRLSSLDDVRRELAAGDVVTIGRGTSDFVEGRLLRISDTTVDVRTEARMPTGRRQRLDLTIPWRALTSLERRRDSTRDGTLIGAGVGGGASLAMFVYAAVVDYNEIDEWAAGYLAGGVLVAGIGAVIGWAIDRAHSKPHLRFDAPTRQGVETRAVSPGSRRHGLTTGRP
jgi:hypothetical protein